MVSAPCNLLTHLELSSAVKPLDLMVRRLDGFSTMQLLGSPGALCQQHQQGPFQGRGQEVAELNGLGSEVEHLWPWAKGMVWVSCKSDAGK